MDAGGDWRAQLQPERRSKIVNKIVLTLRKHLPVQVPEGQGLVELQRIAVRFEDKVYAAATTQAVSTYGRFLSNWCQCGVTQIHNRTLVQVVWNVDWVDTELMRKHEVAVNVGQLAAAARRRCC